MKNEPYTYGGVRLGAAALWPVVGRLTTGVSVGAMIADP